MGNYALVLVDLNSSEDMTQARLVYTVNATSPGKENEVKEKKRKEKRGEKTVNASSPGIHLCFGARMLNESQLAPHPRLRGIE